MSRRKTQHESKRARSYFKDERVRTLESNSSFISQARPHVQGLKKQSTYLSRCRVGAKLLPISLVRIRLKRRKRASSIRRRDTACPFVAQWWIMIRTSSPITLTSRVFFACIRYWYLLQCRCPQYGHMTVFPWQSREK